MVGIISSELESLESGLQSAPITLSLPFLNIVVYFMIWIKIGIRYCIGILLITIITTVILLILSKIDERFTYKEGIYNDEWVNLINDTIVGIKTIKCFNRE